MSVAHIDLLQPTLEDAEPRRLARRLAVVLGGIGMLALAAVPSVLAVLLFIRPDLFLSY
jgi:hypothetical protein